MILGQNHGFMKYRSLLTHSFVTDTFWFGLSSSIVNLLNYTYVLLALNYMSKESFGAFNALVAILTMAMAIAAPLLLHISKEVSNPRTETLQVYFVSSQKKILKFASIGFIVGVVIAPVLSSTLRVSTGNIFFLWLVVAALIFATSANGVSTGLKKLTFQASINAGASIVKLFLGWFLFEAGFGIRAGLGGYLAGFLLTISLTWLAMRKWETTDSSRPVVESCKESISVLVVAYAFVAIPFSMDQILAQAFNPRISGDYSALATLGKLVFFASSPFLIVLYSYLVKARDEHLRQTRYFLAGLAVAEGAALLVTAFLWIGGREVTGLLLTPAYGGVSEWVVMYCLGMCGYVFSYAVALLGIVRNDWRLVVFSGIASLAQIILFSLRNATLDQLITNQIICYSLLAMTAIVSLCRYLFYSDKTVR
jgi:O-antigen/teichoic acid export membrane protein